MKIEVQWQTRDQWGVFSEQAHKIVFSEKRPSELERYDYALVGINQETRDLLGYATVRELDGESVYWQYGGAFPTSKASVWALQVYQAFVAWTRARYKRVTTLVESENVAYLKLAMAVGFRVIGCRTFKGKIYCELLNDFEKGEKLNG